MADTGGNGGYIRLHRQILKWEWYQNVNTFRLFIHLLLRANYCDMKFEGKTIHRGQLITSLPKLAQETSLSIQQVRTSLLKLVSTGEITDSSTRQSRIITIVNYDRYQVSTDNQQTKQQTKKIKSTDKVTDEGNDIGVATVGMRDTDYEIPTDELTDNQQTDKQTNQHQVNKYIKNIKKYTNKPLSRFIVPTVDEVAAYCLERENHVSASRFCDYYDSVGWMVGKGKPMKDWKAAVRRWERDERTERDYQDDMRGLPV